MSPGNGSAERSDFKVFLVGPMGSGKTTVGKELAYRLGVPVLDLDEAIESAADKSIPAIFEAEGEAGFRDREEAALRALIQAGEPAVVATGGGVVLREANRRRMAEAGRAVYLHAPVEVLLERVKGDTNRPLLQVADPRAKLEALQAERDPLYREACLTVETAGRTPAEIADEVLARLDSGPANRVD